MKVLIRIPLRRHRPLALFTFVSQTPMRGAQNHSWNWDGGLRECEIPNSKSPVKRVAVSTRFVLGLLGAIKLIHENLKDA